MDWAPILDQVVRTPGPHRHPIGAEAARRLLACAADDVAALTDAYGPGGLDAFDVWNIGLYSGSRRSQPEMEMRYMGRVFATTDWLAPVRYEIRAEARCPRGPGCEGGPWTPPPLLDTAWSGFAAAPGRARWTGTVARTGRGGAVSSPVIADVWREALATWRFHYTYPPLETAAATRARRVGTCVGLAEALAACLRERGVEARVRHGLLWGGIAAQRHQWVEARDTDGAWKTLDVSMALLSGMFFGAAFGGFCYGSQVNCAIPVAAGAAAAAGHDCGGQALAVPVDVGRPPRAA